MLELKFPTGANESQWVNIASLSKGTGLFIGQQSLDTSKYCICGIESFVIIFLIIKKKTFD